MERIARVDVEPQEVQRGAQPIQAAHLDLEQIGVDKSKNPPALQGAPLITSKNRVFLNLKGYYQNNLIHTDSDPLNHPRCPFSGVEMGEDWEGASTFRARAGGHSNAPPLSLILDITILIRP